MFRNTLLTTAAVLAAFTNFLTPAFAQEAPYGACQTQVEHLTTNRLAAVVIPITKATVASAPLALTFKVNEGDDLYLPPYRYDDASRYGNPVAVAWWEETNPDGFSPALVAYRDKLWANSGQLVAIVAFTGNQDPPAQAWDIKVIGPLSGSEPCAIRARFQSHILEDVVGPELTDHIFNQMPEDRD